ncbi:HAD domain-containing protein [Cryobacterium sp. Y29]|uniref:HAD domain-containing protein n=1 Tax=Cryobacterium sp. Y29 TaxID=2048285 RepID=UPI000CE2F019|nr:HAD domain-containing protein [Cryobacterium sp. Y29]
MTGTTRLYLDVDGTVSPIGTTPPEGSGWAAWGSGRAYGFTVIWARGLITELNAITARSDVQPVWLTSWETYALSDLAPVTGLNAAGWQVLQISGRNPEHGSEKLEALLEDVAAQNLAGNQIGKVVWLDDVVDEDDEWEEKYGPQPELAVLLGIPVLRLRPVSEIGLTPDHMAQVRDFIR